MSLGVRIFLVYVLFVALSGYFVLRTVMDEIRPGVRQSTEETLVDTANLLAEVIREDVKAGTLNSKGFPEILRAYRQRKPDATIWGIKKSGIANRIYVTDGAGKLLLDTAGDPAGQDYSRWNDVYRTLRGEYGARSTTEQFADGPTSVMYVAAPIIDDGLIIGVVSVSKPEVSLQPYIERSQWRLISLGIGLIFFGLIVGAALSWWLSSALRRLTEYAQTVSEGHRAQLPSYQGGELAQLAAAIEHMRVQLEGKAYVERYVQTLTHELKSPLAAIRGAAELLHDNLPDAQRQRFVTNIDNESLRLQQLIERLLNLAMVEQRKGLEEHVVIPLRTLMQHLLYAQEGRTLAAELTLKNEIDDTASISGERFLVQQALSNLLENALDFTPRSGLIRVTSKRIGTNIQVSIFNEGPAIPDYALPRLTERFYSLPRPATGRKSTGLGLNFVNEVAELHGGSLSVKNIDNGVESIVTFPAT